MSKHAHRRKTSSADAYAVGARTESFLRLMLQQRAYRTDGRRTQRKKCDRNSIVDDIGRPVCRTSRFHRVGVCAIEIDKAHQRQPYVK